MQKKLLVSAVTLALGVAAESALALIDLDNTTTPTVFYASEINFESGSSVGGSAIDSTVTLGAGFASGNTDVYTAFRVNCGTFSGNNFENSDLVSVDGGNVTLATKGATGDNVVVFNIEPPSAGLSIGSSLNLSFSTGAPTNISVTDTSQTCTLTYRLYNNLVNASNFDSSFIKEASAPLFGFKSGLNFGTLANTDPSTADVSTAFLNFTLDDQAGSPVITNLGLITMTDEANVYSASGGLLSATPATVDVIGSDANMVISGADNDTGAMAAVTGMWLSASSGCTTQEKVGVLDKTAGTATFAVANAVFVNYHVCVQMDGTSTIPSAKYVATLNPGTSPTGYVVSNIPAALLNDRAAGEVDQNGTVLQATFTSGFNYQVSRFIFINRGSAPAPITEVRKYSNTGVETFAAPVASIPANSRLAINATDMPQLGVAPGSLTAGFSGAVEFVIGAQDDNIEGAYQYKIDGSDVQTVVQMARPVSKYGQ